MASPGERPLITRPRTLRTAGWLLAAAALMVATLYIANLPFYAGSSVGRRLSWRMEHGRLRADVRPAGSAAESFYIAINSEGLKFKPEWRFYSAGHWHVIVPLWLPLGVCALGSAALFNASRRRLPAVAHTSC